jgi:hypothetical protein
MLLNTHLQAHRTAYLTTRFGLTIITVAAVAFALLAGPIHAEAEGKPPSKTQKRAQLTIAPEEAMKPWTGDLDGMIERGVIRVLTVYSKTFFM